MSDEQTGVGAAVDDALGEYYAAGYERDRLFSGHGQLERVRTQELIARYLPSPPAEILDVGGGPGIYAHWLADRGYMVHLVDPIPLHVKQALAERGPVGRPLASARVGDARQIEHPDASVDAALLLGPLYHLTERADRLQALREARRATQSGGWLFAAGISRFASLFDGLYSGFLDDPAFVRIVEQDLRDGQHQNPGNDPAYFTTAYFHHPDELRADVQEAGWSIVAMAGIEGPGAWIPSDFAAWWNDEVRRERLLEAARAVESESSLLGLSPHIMAIARNI